MGVGVKVGNQPQMVRDGGCSVANICLPKGVCFRNIDNTGALLVYKKAVRGLKTRGTSNKRTENIERPNIRLIDPVDALMRRGR